MYIREKFIRVLLISGKKKRLLEDMRGFDHNIYDLTQHDGDTRKQNRIILTGAGVTGHYI